MRRRSLHGGPRKGDSRAGRYGDPGSLGLPRPRARELGRGAAPLNSVPFLSVGPFQRVRPTLRVTELKGARQACNRGLAFRKDNQAVVNRGSGGGCGARAAQSKASAPAVHASAVPGLATPKHTKAGLPRRSIPRRACHAEAYQGGLATPKHAKAGSPRRSARATEGLACALVGRNPGVALTARRY